MIFDILYRFWKYPVALTSDIEKAFLQISIEPMERNYLRFLWYDDVFSDFPKFKRLRFARVIFGVTSPPFLLNGTIWKHIGNYPSRHRAYWTYTRRSEDLKDVQFTSRVYWDEYDQAFVGKIENSFYVDDFSWGDISFETDFELHKKLRVRFAEGYFKGTLMQIWKSLFMFLFI